MNNVLVNDNKVWNILAWIQNNENMRVDCLRLYLSACNYSYCRTVLTAHWMYSRCYITCDTLHQWNSLIIHLHTCIPLDKTSSWNNIMKCFSSWLCECGGSLWLVVMWYLQALKRRNLATFRNLAQQTIQHIENMVRTASDWLMIIYYNTSNIMILNAILDAGVKFPGWIRWYSNSAKNTKKGNAAHLIVWITPSLLLVLAVPYYVFSFKYSDWTTFPEI